MGNATKDTRKALDQPATPIIPFWHAIVGAIEATILCNCNCNDNKRIHWKNNNLDKLSINDGRSQQNMKNNIVKASIQQRI